MNDEEWAYRLATEVPEIYLDPKHLVEERVARTDHTLALVLGFFACCAWGLAIYMVVTR